MLPEPQLLLPFAEREYIDIRRTAGILSLSPTAVIELYQRGLIEILDYRPGGRKRVRYQSIVDLCDELRTRYCIRDRRPALPNPIFRHRDEDLLPFPWTDTMSVRHAREVLGYSTCTPIYHLCEEGVFESYHFSSESPWRISRQSFSEYVRRIRDRERLPATR